MRKQIVATRTDKCCYCCLHLCVVHTHVLKI